MTKLSVTPSHELMMEAELDPDHYRTKTLIKALDSRTFNSAGVGTTPDTSPRYTACRKGAIMPRIETIKASDAPAPPKKMSKASQQILDAINNLKRDQVLRLQPDPDQSMRGLKMSVARTASRNDVEIESWTDEAQEYLYVRTAR